MSPEQAARLVALLQAQDERGFSELLHRYGRRFRWYFIRCGMTGGEAEDCAVDLLTEIAMNRIQRFGGDGSGLRSWLNTLMRREAINWHRRRKGIRVEALDGHFAHLKAADPGEEEPDLAISAALESALAGLAPRDRQLVELRALDGLTFKEIAAALRISPDNAKVRFMRLRRTIQVTLGARPTGDRRRSR